VSLVGEWRIWGGQARFAARLTSRTRSEYDFLLGRFSSFPLGGTSNHFRASALRWLMAWDPFNVTAGRSG